MRIVLCYTHHPRCIAHYFRRAFRTLGHDVRTVGPWADEWPLGTEGREPDIELHRYSRGPLAYPYGYVCGDLPHDLFILIDSGEGLKVWGITSPWAHLALEGTHLEWSDTPHKFASLMQHVQNPNSVKWVPGGFDIEEHRLGKAPSERVLDLAQIAIPYNSRLFMAQRIATIAPDLRSQFGELWGPAYGDTYRDTLATWVGSGQDFVTMRVFECMAMGCIVIADRTKSISTLFKEGEHFIGYDPLWTDEHEAYPDPEWLVSTVRELRRNGDGGMAKRARELVENQHSWCHRAQFILDSMGLK